jgi:CHASE3 domain sensor protein
VSFQTELISIAIRAMTGVLYTDSQIKTITSGATGKYLKEFFPYTKDELEAKNRVDTAREHIDAASTIIRDMQEDLEAQDVQLNELLDTIKEKKKLADRYQTLADTNKEAFVAFKIEMEEALRKELVEQATQGKRTRQAVSFVLWVITLVIGAALGTYFKDIMTWLGFA